MYGSLKHRALAGSPPTPYLAAPLQRFQAATEATRYSTATDVNGMLAYRNPAALRASSSLAMPGATRITPRSQLMRRVPAPSAPTMTVTPMAMPRGFVPQTFTDYRRFTGPMPALQPSMTPRIFTPGANAVQDVQDSDSAGTVSFENGAELGPSAMISGQEPCPAGSVRSIEGQCVTVLDDGTPVVVPGGGAPAAKANVPWLWIILGVAVGGGVLLYAVGKS